MHIRELTKSDKEVSTASMFKTEHAQAMAIHIRREGALKRHSSPIPALLVCVEGLVEYEDEQGLRVELRSGSYVQIEPQVVHWLYAVEESTLILFK
ncbi:MAG: hypothetical protein H6606_01540 [Flavobacteriales bacterium]|nr:hypothetical protein [Flavobacteriales bacterium]